MSFPRIKSHAAREFSAAVQRAAWARCNGQCEYERPDGERCSMLLTVCKFVLDHVDPWFFSRDSSLTNCQVICKDLRSPVDHFGFSSLARTTTGSSLRVRSLWISTILAE